MSQNTPIVIAGATGFIGRRLTAELVRRNQAVRCLSRSGDAPQPGVEALAVDLTERDTLARALQGAGTAYYLVHSLAAGTDRFAEQDRLAAENFVAAADASGLEQVIYLSGLGRLDRDLSAHLRSRIEVAGILCSGTFQTTVLRAAIIIGAGSASFEILRFLVLTQLLLPDLAALETRSQPIAIDNVVHYLAGCLEDQRTAAETFDIGGPEVLTYREMLETFAAVAKTKNLFLPVPGTLSQVAAGLIGALSGVKRSVALALLEGLANEMVCTENRIQDILPQRLIPYAEAVRKALQDRETQRASS